MTITTPKLTDEMREALQENPEQRITVQDDRTHAYYVLLPQEKFEELDRFRREQELRAKLQVAFDQTDRGECGPWDIEATIAQAHRRLAGDAS